MKKLILIFSLLACLPVFAQTTVAISPLALPQFMNNSGGVCSGCKLSTFSAGTTTPLATFQDSAGSVLQANPIVMDSTGRPSNGSANVAIFLQAAAYKFVMKDANGVQLWQADNVSWATPLSTFAGITSTGNVVVQPSTAATSGANQSSPTLCIDGFYFNVSSLTDQWCLSDVLGTGTSPTSTLNITHSGSGGTASIVLPNIAISGVSSLSAGVVTTTGAGTGGVGTAAGGAINSQKPASSGAIFMGRFVDAHGDTNAQLLGFNVEQMINPTSSVSYQNSAFTGELFIPIGNTQNFTGSQVAADFAFVNYGSGALTLGAGIIGEAWNSGPATSVTELTGIAGGAHNGSVSAGIPVQVPTGNGSVANARGVKASVSNSSTGTITTAAGVHIDSATNTGGGSITTNIGLNINDQTVGGTNFAIKTGAGTVSFADKVQAASTLYATGGSGTGAAAFGTTGLLAADVVFVGGSASTSGTTQNGIQVAATLGGTASSAAIVARADVPASTTITTNIGMQIATPSIGGSGVITNWHGLRIEKAPTAGTAHSIFIAGSTSGNSFLDAPATGGVANILPTTAGTLGVIVASGTSTLTANATLASVTSQTAITTTATGAATTDSIEWSYASAPGAGDSLCIVSPYVTSGNVNFVRSNPTAAAQNVSAIVINWRVIR